MLINTFWKIVIKIIGLWLLFSCISIIPQFLSAISFINGELNIDGLLMLWLTLFGVIAIYILIIRLFLFKTDYIIEKLKLENSFNENRIDLNMKSTTVITIAIIVIGSLILIESLPNFCSRLFEYYRLKNQLTPYNETAWLIYYFIKVVIGYLLLTNSKVLTKLIIKESSENQTNG
ncbi:hypothetical protein ABDJ41_22750 [Pedobacter sp. ASV1-7]|uniref:hypothetical protein n=1 Tax=Pedobacter sp. ASV1-7 TaxID=3145237 RepID=UPI0032E867C6